MPRCEGTDRVRELIRDVQCNLCTDDRFHPRIPKVNLQLQSDRREKRRKFQEDDTKQGNTLCFLSSYFLSGFSYGLSRNMKRGLLFVCERGADVVARDMLNLWV